jgi:hypothetical protein
MRLELQAIATHHQAGDKYHPAIMSPMGKHYWPNITFATMTEAISFAKLSLEDAETAANEEVSQWNVWPTSQTYSQV